MIRERLEKFIRKRATLLGVGPMSRSCIDVAIQLANEYRLPLLLIASRRQIDRDGGYVENFTTRRFADYVLDRDSAGKVLLCRDHGGPWQSEREKREKLCLKKAMESAKESYREDILSGFQILHIDTSVDIWGTPTQEEVVDRMLELYEYCWETARRFDRKIEFEIGAEEQSGSTGNAEEFTKMLQAVNRHCERNHLPKPLFVVVQTGTKVVEMRNVGSFDIPVRIADEIPPEIQVPIMSGICQQQQVYMKAHNTDYLSDASLQWYPRLGIHAANVAPEFGVAETATVLRILEENNLHGIRQELLRRCVESGKWEKWMVKDSAATDLEKAMIAGHYNFSTAWYQEMLREAQGCLEKKGVLLHEAVCTQLRKAVLRYLADFRMV